MTVQMVDEQLIDAAVAQAARRWPGRPSIAAAVRVDSGLVFTGVSLFSFNAALSLCAETGPICAAYSLGRRVLASVSVNVDFLRGDVTVLAPCGACQERLAVWGPDVQVGVTDASGAAGWSSQSLAAINPHYWAAAIAPGRVWPTQLLYSD